MTHHPLLLTAILLGFILSTSCKPAAHDDEHSHGDEHGHDDHGPEHAQGGLSATHWGETLQVYAAFEPLVLNRAQRFAVHLTRLDTHEQLTRASVSVVLSGGGQPEERFVSDAPTEAGLFVPTLTPRHAGKRAISVEVTLGESSSLAPLGEFIVFSSEAGGQAALRASQGEHQGEGIGFALERQWAVPFKVARATLGPVRPSIPAFAHVQLTPGSSVTITAPFDGRLLASGRDPLSVGTSITKGELLFVLSAAPSEGANTASLDQDVDRAAIDVAAARREVDRLTPLVEQGVVASRRLDVAQSELAGALAMQRGASRRRTNLNQSQRVGGRGERVEIPAPIDGTLARLIATPGTWVAKGQPLAQLIDGQGLWLEIGVPESKLGQLEQISGAWFSPVGSERVVELGREALISVATELDPDTRTLPVRFRLGPKHIGLVAGMMTQARLATGAPREAVSIPVSALVDDSGVDVVYVQRDGERFERRPVRLGIRDGSHVEVVSGVEDGEWVVAKNPYVIKLASMSTESIGHGHAH